MDFCGSKAMLASIDRQRWVLHMEFGLEKMQGLQYPNLKWWMTSRRFLVVLLVFFARHLMIVVAIGYVTFCLFVVYSLFLCFFVVVVFHLFTVVFWHCSGSLQMLRAWLAKDAKEHDSFSTL